jgi:hypothetical protein
LSENQREPDRAPSLSGRQRSCRDPQNETLTPDPRWRSRPLEPRPCLLAQSQP